MSRGGSSRQWRRLRAAVEAELVYSGEAPCTRCGEAIKAGEPWDLDHVRPVVLGGTDALDNVGPAHPKCNRSAGVRPAAALTSTVW